MNSWFFHALVAVTLYGLWGFFPKLAVGFMPPRSVLIWQAAGVVAVALLTFAVNGFRVEAPPRGILFATLAGASGMAGTLFYIIAASRGRISLVVSLTALYPVFTLALAAWFLREPLSLRQMAGMLLAMVAVVLMGW